MAVTETRTVREIILHAGYRCGAVAIGDTVDTAEEAVAVESLNFMLKAWQNSGYNLWTKTGGSLTLTTATNYTLNPIRPLRILSARYRESSTANEIPMLEMTREEYDALPNKSSEGIPTQFYYDKQREAAKLYVWPVLATAAAQTIEYTYERELEDIAAATDVIDVPGEWWEAVINNLALRLTMDWGVTSPPPLLSGMARDTLSAALDADREGSFMFGVEE